ERIADENTIDKALQRLSTENFNYLCFPSGENGDNLKIASFIKEQRKNNKIFKAVLPNTQGDNEGIINYDSTCTGLRGQNECHLSTSVLGNISTSLLALSVYGNISNLSLECIPYF